MGEEEFGMLWNEYINAYAALLHEADDEVDSEAGRRLARLVYEGGQLKDSLLLSSPERLLHVGHSSLSTLWSLVSFHPLVAPPFSLLGHSSLFPHWSLVPFHSVVTPPFPSFGRSSLSTHWSLLPFRPLVTPLHPALIQQRCLAL